MKSFAFAVALAALVATPALAANPAVRFPADGQKREVRIEQREGHQDKRIEQGIKKGSLTSEEQTKLGAMETSIKQMDAEFEGDGKLTKAEGKQLTQALNDASLQIWAEKHDTDGTQMPVLRLGKNIVADPTLTERIESGSFTKPEAKTFLHELHELVTVKHRLGTEDLTADQRTKLQTRYNDLLSKYFTRK